MNNIKISDINFDSLEKINNAGTKSTIYKYENKCLKILDGLYPTEKLILHYKFLDLEGINIDGVLMPEELIIDNGILCGYTMNYFNNTKSLNSYFLDCKYINSNDVFKITRKVCKILKSIHDKEIIYQDLSFDNILINNEGKIMFCDIDECNYKNYNAPFVSLLLKRLICGYRNENINISKNSDRVSIFISLFYSIYLKEIQFLTVDEYNLLSNDVNLLKSMKKYIDILLDKENEVPDIPYVDELLTINDNYIINRNLFKKNNHC